MKDYKNTLKKESRTKIVYIVCVFANLNIQSLDCIPFSKQNRWSETRPLLYTPYSRTKQLN